MAAISRRYAAYALGVFFTANLFNYLDRFLVSALLSDIQKDFHLNDKEGGILWVAFTVGYMLSAPFIGYLSDRKARVRIFAFCIFLWSIATVGTGIAQTFLELVSARIAIGIGEAGCLIIGPSLISDYFQRKARGKMLSIFYLGVPLGGAAGYLTGGLIAADHGWRMAFFIAGAPGAIIAILMWILIEPQRGAMDESPSHGAPKANLGMKDYFDLLRIPSLLMIIFAQAAAVFAFVPLLHFAAKYFETVRGFTKPEANMLMVLASIAGIAGSFIGGIAGDWLNKKTRAAYAIVAAVGYTLGIPFILLGLFSTAQFIYVSSMIIGPLFIFMCMPVVNTHIANVVNARQRAMAYAVTVFVLHLLGDTVSPILFGAMSDSVGMGEAFFIFPFTLLLSGALCLIAARYAAGDIEKANRID